MAEDPNLSGLNDAANSDPSAEHVTVEKIKSADKPVGGVNVGAIDQVSLSEQEYVAQVNDAVDRALEFKPIKMKSPAVLSAAAQIRKTFLGVNQYINARHVLTKQLERLLPKNGIKSEDRQKTIDAIILERNLEMGHQEAQKVRLEQLNVSRNMLKFQTSVAAVFMRQSLALQYRSLFTLKDLLTITKAFADMAENKLDAIKINTQLPDTKKKTFMEEVTSTIRKKAITSAGKAAMDFLSHETIDDALASVHKARDKAVDVIKKVRNFKFSSYKPADSTDPTTQKAKIPIRQRIKDALAPESLWNVTKMPREAIADMIKHSTTKKSSEAILSSILAELTKQNSSATKPTSGADDITGPMHVENPGSSSIIATELSKIMDCVCELRGTFKDYKELYEKSSSKIYELIFNIDKNIADKSFHSSTTESTSNNTPKPNRFSSPKDRDYFSVAKTIKGDMAGQEARREQILQVPSIANLNEVASKQREEHIASSKDHMGKNFFEESIGKNKKSTNSAVTKKDLMDFVSLKLDKIYSLLDARIPKPVIAGSYQDHENREKNDENALIRRREEEGFSSDGTSRSGISERLGKLIGIGGAATESDSDTTAASEDTDTTNRDSDKSEKKNSGGGVVGDLETGAGIGLSGLLANKVKTLFPKLKGIKNLFSGKTAKTVEAAVSTPEIETAAKDVLKTGSKFGLVSGILGKVIEPLWLAKVAINQTKDLYDNDVSGTGQMPAPWTQAGKMALAVNHQNDKLLFSWFKNIITGSNSSGTKSLLKARLEAYGTDETKTDVIMQIEERSSQMIASNGSNPFQVAELKVYAKFFGLDPNDNAQFNYFCSWIDGRFRDGYLIYVATVKKYGYDPSYPSSIKDSDIQKILSNYNAVCSVALSRYSNLIPSQAGFKRISPQTNDNTFQANPFLSKPTVSKPPVAQQPAYTIPQAYNPEKPPSLIQAAYIVPAATTGQPQSSIRYTGVQTEKLTYTPGSYNASNVSGTNLNGLPTSPVGSGECVALVQQVCKVGNTSTWKPGPRVVSTPNLKPGTPIASFDIDGTYGNHTDGRSHAAIYLGQSQVYPGGIRVYDQWNGHAPSARDMRPQEALACNSANAFSVIVSSSSQVGNIANNNTPPVSNGYTPFNGASIPGASAGGIQPSIAVQMASARAGYVKQAGLYSPQSTPTTQDNIPSSVPTAPTTNTVPGAMPGGIQPSTAVQAAATKAGYTQQPLIGTVNSAPSQPISGSQTQSRAIQAVNYFMSQGWTKEQASGIVGSLIRESQLNTTAVGDGGNAEGIAQWHSDRYGPILDALYPGKSIKDLTFEQQLAAVQWELNGPEKRAASMLKTATDPGTAGAYASKYYERPANTSAEMQTRAGLAETVFNSYNKNPDAAKQAVQNGSVATASTQSTTGTPSSNIASATPSTGDQTTSPSVQNATYSPPSSAAANYSGGPSSNVISPVQNNVAVAGTVQQATMAATQQASYTVPPVQQQPVQATFHPDVINAIRTSANVAQQQLAALGNIHKTMSGVYNHLQQVHGPDGVFSTIADNTSTSNANQASTIFAPVINPPKANNNNSHDDVGFSVKKKRNPRYEM